MNAKILTAAGQLATALVAEQDKDWRCLYCADALRILMDAMDDTVAITALEEAESLIRADAFENLRHDESAMYIQQQEQAEQRKQDLLVQLESYLLRPQAF